MSLSAQEYNMLANASLTQLTQLKEARVDAASHQELITINVIIHYIITEIRKKEYFKLLLKQTSFLQLDNDILNLQQANHQLKLELEALEEKDQLAYIAYQDQLKHNQDQIAAYQLEQLRLIAEFNEKQAKPLINSTELVSLLAVLKEQHKKMQALSTKKTQAADDVVESLTLKPLITFKDGTVFTASPAALTTLKTRLSGTQSGMSAIATARPDLLREAETSDNDEKKSYLEQLQKTASAKAASGATIIFIRALACDIQDQHLAQQEQKLGRKLTSTESQASIETFNKRYHAETGQTLSKTLITLAQNDQRLANFISVLRAEDNLLVENRKSQQQLTVSLNKAADPLLQQLGFALKQQSAPSAELMSRMNNNPFMEAFKNYSPPRPHNKFPPAAGSGRSVEEEEKRRLDALVKKRSGKSGA